MKEFGLQLWSIQESFKTVEDTHKAFQWMKECGYTQAQTAGTYDYIAPEQFKEFADESGIKIIGTHYDYGRMRDDIEGTIRYHRILDTNIIGIGGYGCNNLDDTKAFIKEFNDLAAIYAKEGFKLSYHNHSFEFSNVMKKYEGKTYFDYLVEGLDPENVCFCLDAGWTQLAGVDVRAVIERLRGRIKIVHLKDVEATEQGPRRIEVGCGNMNFGGIIETAEDCGAEFFIVEDEVYSTGNPLESVKISADNIKNRWVK